MADPAEEERLALELEGFSGPLDLLLDLAREQKVDLARISILSLVEQYLTVIEGARRIRLELAADWLVMAAWLAWLKSRLLLPEKPALEETETQTASSLLALRLQGLDLIRRGAAWLGTRPQLGQDVFARGLPEDFTVTDRSRLALDAAGLVRAYLSAHRRGLSQRRYTPPPMVLWSVQDALARLRRLVGSLPAWTVLEQFLPELEAAPALARRAAYASTLLAGLEMARLGQLTLRQETAFGPIAIGPAP